MKPRVITQSQTAFTQSRVRPQRRTYAVSPRLKRGKMRCPDCSPPATPTFEVSSSTYLSQNPLIKRTPCSAELFPNRDAGRATTAGNLTDQAHPDIAPLPERRVAVNKSPRASTKRARHIDVKCAQYQAHHHTLPQALDVQRAAITVVLRTRRVVDMTTSTRRRINKAQAQRRAMSIKRG